MALLQKPRLAMKVLCNALRRRSATHIGSFQQSKTAHRIKQTLANHAVHNANHAPSCGLARNLTFTHQLLSPSQGEPISSPSPGRSIGVGAASLWSYPCTFQHHLRTRLPADRPRTVGESPCSKSSTTSEATFTSINLLTTLLSEHANGSAKASVRHIIRRVMQGRV
jgi:hypothetical protein